MTERMLKSAFELAFLKEGHVISTFSDSYETFVGSVATQVENRKANKGGQEQIHHPLVFLGGKLTNNQEIWTTYGKEAFAIVKVLEKLYHMLSVQNQVRVYTVHRNLVYVCATPAMRPSTLRYVIAKVHIWVIHLL